MKVYTGEPTEGNMYFTQEESCHNQSRVLPKNLESCQTLLWSLIIPFTANLYTCVCVCVWVCERERQLRFGSSPPQNVMFLLLSTDAWSWSRNDSGMCLQPEALAEAIRVQPEERLLSETSPRPVVMTSHSSEPRQFSADAVFPSSVRSHVAFKLPLMTFEL